MLDFLVIDLETPNRQNSSICSIGLVTVIDGAIKDRFYYMVNPQSDFDEKNIQIHGISESDIINKPTFAEIWQSIIKLFHNTIVVAHNAQFDLLVLEKALTNYNINMASIAYVDTLSIAKSTDNCAKYSLDALCRYRNIELAHHHNALEDANACAELLIQYIVQGINISQYIEKYQKTISEDFKYRYYSNHSKSSQLNYIFDSSFLDSIATKEYNQQSKNIVLSGDFKCSSKDLLKKDLESQGFYCSKTVTRKTEILIVGSMGSSLWKNGNYGTKIQKAMELINNGVDIQIVMEHDFFKKG